MDQAVLEELKGVARNLEDLIIRNITDVLLNDNDLQWTKGYTAKRDGTGVFSTELNGMHISIQKSDSVNYHLRISESESEIVHGINRRRFSQIYNRAYLSCTQ